MIKKRYKMCRMRKSFIELDGDLQTDIYPEVDASGFYNDNKTY